MVDNSTIKNFFALNEFVGDITGIEQKHMCIIVDFQLEDGTYLWRDFYTTVPVSWDGSEIMDILPDILKGFGYKGKVRIGSVAISFDYFNTEELKEFNERLNKGDIPEMHVVKEMIKHFTFLHLDPTY